MAKTTEYQCGVCGRRLPLDRWIYSRHTGARYCWPGECRKTRPKKEESPVVTIEEAVASTRFALTAR